MLLELLLDLLKSRGVFIDVEEVVDAELGNILDVEEGLDVRLEF